jgi:hypothetical protein
MFARDGAGKPIVGTLMRVEEDPNSRYRFEIWFDYTREIMNTLAEGAMVAVPNFFLDPKGRGQDWLSVLEITTLLPIHYAIAQSQSGFPGFLEEAARSAAQDWIDQESESTDDTTKVRCVAIPTNLMLNDDGEIREEQGLPMVGHKTSLLGTEMTERLANLGIDRQRDNVACVGPLIRDENVSIYLRVEEALRTHFAVFGYTGAGKSNLLSTLVAKFLGARGGQPPVKLVVFDLMSEFATLLMDLLVDLPHARLLAVGPATLPDSCLDYYAAPSADRPRLLARAATDLARTTLYPKSLKPRRDEFGPPFATLLREARIRVWQERDRTLGEFVRERRSEVVRGNMGNDRAGVFALLDRLEADFAEAPFSQEATQHARDEIRRVNQGLNNTATQNLRNLDALIQSEYESLRNQRNAPEACRVTIPKVVERLNAEDESSLIVVQSADPDELRSFARSLGMALYQERRRSGQITPQVSFVFDEADEFIPQNPDRDSSYAESTAIAHTLARRGRKFGLGIGIATQRVTYLNTSIMAQPHTYFISKLPRKSDRERVCEAFGISEEMFRQTFKFRKGNWLLVSHDATGLESVPLPIRTENADERISGWLDRFKDTADTGKRAARSIAPTR